MPRRSAPAEPRDELSTVPSPGHEGPRGGGDAALPLRGRGAAGVSACRRRHCGLGGGFPVPGQLAPQKLRIPHRTLGRARHRTEPRLPPAWGLGLGGSGSRPLQPARPGLIDSNPVDEEVLRALMLELGLDRADELPELRLVHHEFDPPADLPAGC